MYVSKFCEQHNSWTDGHNELKFCMHAWPTPPEKSPNFTASLLDMEGRSPQPMVEGLTIAEYRRPDMASMAGLERKPHSSLVAKLSWTSRGCVPLCRALQRAFPRRIINAIRHCRRRQERWDMVQRYIQQLEDHQRASSGPVPLLSPEPFYPPERPTSFLIF